MTAGSTTSSSTTPGTPGSPSAPGVHGSLSSKSIASINGEVVLSVDPDFGDFLPTGGTSEHMLVNLSSQRLAIKVRCSDNALFRVNPVFCFIEPGLCTSLIINRLPGPPKYDKIVLHFMKNGDKDAQIKEIFKAPNANPEKLTIPLNCSNSAAKDNEDDKLPEKK